MSNNIIEFIVRGVDNFSKPLGKVDDSLLKTAANTKLFAAGLVTAATAMFAFTAKVTVGMDAAVKSANQLNASVEVFNGFKYVVGSVDVSMEAFTQSMVAANKKTIDAVNGVKSATDIFNTLNISAKQFKDLSLEKKMFTLADSISKVKSPADQLNIATELLGASGGRMLEVLKDGGGTMRDLIKNAQDLGVTFRDDAGKSATEFQDALYDTRTALSSLGQSVATTLAPAFTFLTKGFTIIINAIRKWYDATIATLKFLSIAFIAFGDNIVTWLWESLKGAINLIVEFATYTGKALRTIFTGGSLSEALEGFSKVWTNSIGKAADNIEQKATETNSVLKMAFTDFALPTSDFENLSAAIIGTADAVEETDKKVKKVKESLKETKEYTVELGGGIQFLNEGIGDYIWNLADQTNIWLSDMSNNAKSFATEFYWIMDSAIQNISDGIASVIVKGGSLSEVFKKAAQQALTSIISMLIKVGIQKLILSQLIKTTTISEASSQAAAAIGLAGANGVASFALAPWPVDLGAPAFGAAMVTAASGAYAAGSAVGAGLGAAIGAAHGGLSNVPNEATYRLQKNERVLSPSQNKDLTNFLIGNGGSNGGSVVIENITIHILENANDPGALLNMSKVELDKLVAGPIIDSLNRLDARGIRQSALERKRS